MISSYIVKSRSLSVATRFISCVSMVATKYALKILFAARVYLCMSAIAIAMVSSVGTMMVAAFVMAVTDFSAANKLIGEANLACVSTRKASKIFWCATTR